MTPQELQTIKQRFGIIGNSPQLNHAIEVAAQVAPTNMTVLITGESGTGKESFSKIIHQTSARKHGQFIAINCGAIPEGTIDSELFGHEKGSFTGALDARKGYFEVTNGGTIFLDEIGEMPLGTQARVLRVLENGEFIRVGSSKVQKTDVRVVAATNVNLIDAVQKGKFREDLYYRLNTVPILVPPLRSRGEDIELLFRKFATDFAESYRLKPLKLDHEARMLLLRYPFPGNIRQLKNLAEQISILEIERGISVETLAKYLPNQSTSRLPTLTEGAGSTETFTDRDILFKILFDLKKDFNELKSMFLQLVQNPTLGEQLVNEHSNLFNQNSSSVPTIQPTGFTHQQPILIEKTREDKPVVIEEENKVEDIQHEEQVESLLIFDHEKDLIVKALKRNQGKRKLAAQELGISERTLYRKLNEYGFTEL
jgi:transcriptional regulator with PAS, ATPase and Fis domain